MAARLIGSWITSPGDLIPDERGETWQAHRSEWEGDSAEEALAACREWTWITIGRQTAFIRQPPMAISEKDFETKVTRHRAAVRFSVLRRNDHDMVGFGLLKEKGAASCQ